MISWKNTGLLVALLITATGVTAQEHHFKTAAVTECIMLDLSSYNTQVWDAFAYFTKEQKRHLLDTILSHLSKRYSLTEIAYIKKIPSRLPIQV